MGKWKDYKDLEDSLSMPELTATLEASRELEQRHNKFLAAIQGVDLDGGQDDVQKIWEDKKAKAFSGGTAENSDDILSLQGINAQKEGFGIGLGLEYSNITNSDNENPWG